MKSASQQYNNLLAELSSLNSTQPEYWYIMGSLAVLRQAIEESK